MRHISLFTILIGLFLVGCPHQGDREAPSPAPIKPPDTDLCGKMCAHLGPKDKGGLGCEEGTPVYNSDKPGPVDVPNETCEEFCKVSQDRGAFMNPRCVMLVPSCDKVEEYRKKAPETCKE
jgi:hypothetical protein